MLPFRFDVSIHQYMPPMPPMPGLAGAAGCRQSRRHSTGSLMSQMRKCRWHLRRGGKALRALKLWGECLWATRREFTGLSLLGGVNDSALEEALVLLAAVVVAGGLLDMGFDLTHAGLDHLAVALAHVI